VVLSVLAMVLNKSSSLTLTNDKVSLLQVVELATSSSQNGKYKSIQYGKKDPRTAFSPY
jgi:hypothetical protein